MVTRSRLRKNGGRKKVARLKKWQWRETPSWKKLHAYSWETVDGKNIIYISKGLEGKRTFHQVNYYFPNEHRTTKEKRFDNIEKAKAFVEGLQKTKR